MEASSPRLPSPSGAKAKPLSCASSSPASLTSMAPPHLCAQEERSPRVCRIRADFAAHNFLQPMEELHQSGLRSPGPCPSQASADIARGKSFGLSLEVDLRIDVSGVERDVPEPAADRVNVHPGAQQVRSRRVSDDMRADHLVR